MVRYEAFVITEECTITSVWIRSFGVVALAMRIFVYGLRMRYVSSLCIVVMNGLARGLLLVRCRRTSCLLCIILA